MSDSVFDHQPDPELGTALRELLTAPDDAAFARRVVAAAGAVPMWWEVLGAWVRPGLAAALVLTALAGFLLGRTIRTAEPALVVADEPPAELTNGEGAAALFGAPRPPDVDQVLAASRER